MVSQPDPEGNIQALMAVRHSPFTELNYAAMPAMSPVAWCATRYYIPVLSVQMVPAVWYRWHLGPTDGVSRSVTGTMTELTLTVF